MSRLLCGYMLSQPVFASDAQHAKDSLERFSHQLEHDAQMENDTRVPPVDTLIGRHSNCRSATAEIRLRDKPPALPQARLAARRVTRQSCPDKDVRHSEGATEPEGIGTVTPLY